MASRPLGSRVLLGFNEVRLNRVYCCRCTGREQAGANPACCSQHLALLLPAPGNGDLTACCAMVMQPNHGWDQAHLTAKEAAAFWKSHMQPVADRQERAALC